MRVPLLAYIQEGVMTEIWKDIKGYEGLYQVSNFGRVRSMNWRKTGKTKLLAQRNQNRGYLTVLLSKNGESKYELVHRLVAIAFVPVLDSNETVNHIDENRHNNKSDNLEWCSLKENIHKFQENNPDKVGRAENKTNVRQLDKSGTLIRIWDSAAEIKRQMNYNTWSITQCCNSKRKSAYGFIWQYV